MNKQLLSLLTGVVLTLTAGTALAEDPPSAGLNEQVALANRLIALGDARKDPLLLIAAARLQKGLDNQAIVLPAADTSIRSVLERARQYAGKRKDLIGLVDDVAAQKTKSHTLDCAEPLYPPCGKSLVR